MNKKEIEQQIHEFSEKIYLAGYADSNNANLLSEAYQEGFTDGEKEVITEEKAIDLLEKTGWKYTRDKEMIERGMNIVWECIKKIVYSTKDGGLGVDELCEIFGTALPRFIVRDHLPSEVIQKIQAWEEKEKQKQAQADDEIRVGDEVYTSLDENYKYIVTRIYRYDEMEASLLSCDGKWAVMGLSSLHKTGKHYSQIEGVLKELRSGEE